MGSTALQPSATRFDPVLWLGTLSTIGGGYVVGSDRRAFLMVDACDAAALTPVMAQIVGYPDRQQAVRDAIEHGHRPGRA